MKETGVKVDDIKAFWEENYDEAFMDHQFRNLEFEAYRSELNKDHQVVDIGCGKGDVVFELASHVRGFYGVDYQPRRIELAQTLLSQQDSVGNVGFMVGDILNMGFADSSFDRVITSRTLINLPSWELQKKGIREVVRLLKQGGLFLCLEVTKEGWDGYNHLRSLFDLEPVVRPWRNLPLGEEKFVRYVRRYFRIRRIERFGMYYFISRIIQPLFVAPESPSFDHSLNKIAADISRKISHPFSKLSSLDKASYYVYYVLEKK
jgi:ubiquinone/menaquinone biosynthesis C-methylase UbiE